MLLSPVRFLQFQGTCVWYVFPYLFSQLIDLRPMNCDIQGIGSRSMFQELAAISILEPQAPMKRTHFFRFELSRGASNSHISKSSVRFRMFRSTVPTREWMQHPSIETLPP